MPPKMADPRFRQGQWELRYAPHVEEINRFVGDLRSQKGLRIPYVAPHYGGLNAEILFIFQNPGPGTDESRGGSGFLSCENDDPSAELLAECMEEAGLAASRVITWNACPWELPKARTAPSAGDLTGGLQPLKTLLDMLPELRVVAPMGKVAQEGWRRFQLQYPQIAERSRVLEGPHTSGRGITGGGKHTKAQGVSQVLKLMGQAVAETADARSNREREPVSTIRTERVKR
jgi:uracil-DNA glycosylase